MPNISSLTMPDGIVYAIKDSQARKDIEDIKKNSSGSGGGGSGGGVIINLTLAGKTVTADKTAKEIYGAVLSASYVVAYLESEGTTMAGGVNAYKEGTRYVFVADTSAAGATLRLTAEDDNAYPSGTFS